MAEKVKSKKNQGLIIGSCIAVIAVVAIIVFAIIMISNRNSGLVGLNDDYFASDASKLVIPMEGHEVYVEDDLPIPTKYYAVYRYNSDEITGLKTYYFYDDATKAKTIYDYYTDNYKRYYDAINLDGKYMILSIPATNYEGVTVSDVKRQIESIQESAQNELEETELEEIKSEETESEETVTE
ncbi:MAG: hypothetical protein Q4A70_01925 [Candidatus Saccharibacteria bacterium]|nr:hypothetical protein [Candidatus Saccharibacteria bacterium]